MKSFNIYKTIIKYAKLMIKYQKLVLIKDNDEEKKANFEKADELMERKLK